MLHRWPSSPARMSSSSGLRTRWATVMGGLMPLWMQQQRRAARNAGPLTRPRRPRLAVVRWLLLDSLTLWLYTGLASSHCFHTLSIAALGPAADAVERRENPHRTCHPVGVCFSGRAARSPCKRWTSSPAVAGRDGRGRGPAEGGRPTSPESVRGLRGGPAADEMPITSRPAPTPCGACVVAPLRGRSGWYATAGFACAFVTRCLPLPLPGGPGYAYNDRLCAP